MQAGGYGGVSAIFCSVSVKETEFSRKTRFQITVFVLNVQRLDWEAGVDSWLRFVYSVDSYLSFFLVALHTP